MLQNNDHVNWVIKTLCKCSNHPIDALCCLVDCCVDSVVEKVIWSHGMTCSIGRCFLDLPWLPLQKNPWKKALWVFCKKNAMRKRRTWSGMEVKLLLVKFLCCMWFELVFAKMQKGGLPLMEEIDISHLWPSGKTISQLLMGFTGTITCQSKGKLEPHPTGFSK